MGIGADPPRPQETPADAAQTPAQAATACKACEGQGTQPGKFLGSPDEPCQKCGGKGWIEVAEEPLTPWQQRVEKMLRQILAYVEPGVTRDEAEDVTLGLAKGDWP